MQRHPRPIQNRAVLLGVAFALALVMGMLPTVAQDNAKQETAAQENDDQAKQAAFAKKFWDYLQESDYQEKWSRWPGHEEEFIEGTAPHGAFLKVYVNDKVTGNVEDPPAKSIIVKENYNEQKELVAITPMYRVGEDYAPDNNDWYWAKYKPDGTLFEMNNMKVSGRVKGCIECHQSAKGDDYLFSNDK